MLFVTIGCAPTSRFPTVDDELTKAEVDNQRLAAVETDLQQERRLREIAFRIHASNTEFCGGDVAHRMGIAAATHAQFPSESRAVVEAEYGVGDHLTVLYVLAGSPADQAGVRRRDRIVAINGVEMGAGEGAFGRMLEVLDENGGDSATLTVQREGRERTIVAEPVPVCDYGVRVVRSPRIHAWVDVDSIYVTSGMMRVLPDDDELAMLVGHELAHLTRKHMYAKLGNIFAGALVDLLATAGTGVGAGVLMGVGAFSQEFEAEADYVGVYHAARAGFDATKGAGLWRRLAALHPGWIDYSRSTHPSTAKRYVAVEMAAREVERKRREGLPLIPDERRDVE